MINEKSHILKNIGIGISLIVIIAIIFATLFIYIMMHIESGFEKEGIRFKGIGSINNPIEISTADDLKNFAELVNSGETFENLYIEQSNDIDVKEINEFLPIGTDNNCFKGIYNGCGHEIININIDSTKSALFINMGGILKNLTIRSGDIRGNIAAPFAVNSGNNFAKIINCYNHASINGNIRAAGVADNFKNGSIIFCCNYGVIDSNYKYDICGVTAKEIIGCELGEMATSEKFDGYIYSLSGSIYNQTKVINSYMSLCSFGDDKGVKLTVKDGIFCLTSDTLRKGKLDSIDGNGSRTNPYKIKSADDFIIFKDLVNSGIDFHQKYWQQQCNIDLSFIDNLEPVGIYGSEKYFWGVYDGAGYRICNIKMIRQDGCGLFGQLAGTVINVQCEDGYIEGSCVGAIVSHSVPATHPQIINCYSNMTLNGYNRTGYIADNFAGGDIVLCVAESDSYDNKSLICSYEAKNIINSYIIRDGKIDDNAFLEKEDMYVSNEIINTSIDHTLNRYIINNMMIRNINHHNFCLWKNGLSINKYRFAITVNTILTTIIVGLCIFVLLRFGMVILVDDRIKLQIYDTTKHHLLYIILVYGGAIIWIFMNFILRGIGIYNLFFYGLRDTFSDRIAMIDLASKLAGQRYIISPSFYPPINNIIYWIPSLIHGEYLENRDVYLGIDLEHDSAIWMLWVMLFTIFIAALIVVVYKSVNGNSFQRCIIAISVLLFGPVLYSIERGNNTLIAVLFSLLFFKYIKNDNTLEREIALLAVAIAISVKLYPAFFLLYILSGHTETKTKIVDLLKTMIYFCLINAFCFIPYGATNIVQVFVNNLVNARGQAASRTLQWNEGGIDFYNLARFYFNEVDSNRIRWILILSLLLTSLFVLMFSNEKYEKQMMLVIMICMMPIASYYYVLSFLIIPLITILNKNTLGRIDYIIFLLTITILFLGPYYFFTFNFRINGLISSILICIIFFIIYVKNVLCFLRENHIFSFYVYRK